MELAAGSAALIAITFFALFLNRSAIPAAWRRVAPILFGLLDAWLLHAFFSKHVYLRPDRSAAG